MSGTTPAGSTQIEPERLQFRALLLANPNYFGNVKQSPFKPVKKLAGNTTYEELASVGFEPQLNRLDAVVFIKKPFGFVGGLCSDGSQEYVRFYASYDGGATWTDLGLASFTAFDVPEPPTKPFVNLEYAVSLPFAPRRRLCFIDNLVLVRAILSWQVQPPPNTPDFMPVWGNVHNTTIEVTPIRLIKLEDALADLLVKATPQLADAIDLGQPVKAAEPKSIGVAELQRLYGDKVPPHRFALTALHHAITQAPDQRLLAANFGGPAQIFGVQFDVAAAAAAIAAPAGNTTYEALECVGLNPNNFNLEGVIRIKLPNGYSGGPCTSGSAEYVAFWADLDGNGNFETYLGTAGVTVYDIAKIPREGLEFAVNLPTSLFAYRQPCEKGPRLITIRAILSWQIAPPPGNPNYVPIWGNRDDTLVCLPPGPSTLPGVQSAFFDTVGSMSVTKINSVTGLADGASTIGFTAVQSPFGGEVTITGYIYPASNLSAGALPFKYKISVSNDGGANWSGLTDTFTVSRQQLPFGGVPSPLADVVQSVDPSGITAGFYTYQADWTTGPGDALILVTGNVLAKWQTAGKEGLWQIKMDIYDPSTNTFFPAANMTTVLLDNTPPSPAIAITSGGGQCGDFHVGDQISGTYSVSDLHFYDLSFGSLPTNGTFTAPVPLPRFWTDPGASTLGDSGVWTLDTTGLPPCGYVVVLSTVDRTIVNSGSIGWFNQATTGFCLKAKT
jgi:hypothetical protein